MEKAGLGLRLKSSSNMTAAIFLVLALMVFASLISQRHYLRWDLTSTGEHTLTDKTVQILKNVRKPVKIKAFVREGFPEAEDTERLLSAYHYLVPTITYELIDPQKNPAVAQHYNVKTLNTIILEGYGHSQTTKIADEEHVTNALIRLLESKIKKVYWVTGHGERVFVGSDMKAFGKLNEKLSKQNYEFKEINLMREEIPEEASLVVVAAPLKPLFPEELQSLRKYINAGGSVIIFLEPLHDGGLKKFLKSYSVLITDDIIVDKLSRVMGGNYLFPMLVTYADHEITRDFRLTCFFDLARSVEPIGKPKKGVTVTALAKTSTSSWAEMDIESLHKGRARFDAEDRQGPISLAAVVELEPPIKKADEGKKHEQRGELQITGRGKLVVFGDVDFASNSRLELAGNEDFITNTINYMVGREEFITIQRKPKPIEPLLLSRAQGMVVFWIPVVAMPLIMLLLGIVVWLRRRSR